MKNSLEGRIQVCIYLEKDSARHPILTTSANYQVFRLLAMYPKYSVLILSVGLRLTHFFHYRIGMETDVSILSPGLASMI